jgi:hypothetical protein
LLDAVLLDADNGQQTLDEGSAFFLPNLGKLEIHTSECRKTSPDQMRQIPGLLRSYKFLTEEDRVRGFFELAKHARVGSLPGQVYQVPLEGLKLVEELHIAYRRATDAEVKSAHDQVRNPSPVVL